MHGRIWCILASQQLSSRVLEVWGIEVTEQCSPKYSVCEGICWTANTWLWLGHVPPSCYQARSRGKFTITNQSNMHVFWTVGGSQRTWREPAHAQEHVNSAHKGPQLTTFLLWGNNAYWQTTSLSYPDMKNLNITESWLFRALWSH